MNPAERYSDRLAELKEKFRAAHEAMPISRMMYYEEELIPALFRLIDDTKEQE